MMTTKTTNRSSAAVAEKPPDVPRLHDTNGKHSACAAVSTLSTSVTDKRTDERTRPQADSRGPCWLA